MRVTIVERQFGSGFDGMEGVKFGPFADSSHEGIRGAGMIDKTKSGCFFGSIDRLPIIDFDNGDPLLGFGSPPSFPLTDQFSGILPYFLSGAESDFGE